VFEKMSKCPVCGGRVVAEYIGSYGDVYLIGKNGQPRKRRMKRYVYETDGNEPMIYCKDCGFGIKNTGREMKLE